MAKINRRYFLIGLGLTATNCASQVQLGKYIHYTGDAINLTPQDILKRYFTKDAYQQMKDIPVLEPTWLPFNKHGFASDGGFLHSLGGILCGMGPGKKIGYIKSKTKQMRVIEDLVHEYSHQGHYLGLVKTDHVIPHFTTLKELDSKNNIHGKVIKESKLTLAQRIVGVDKNSEIIANLAEYIISYPGNIPRSLHQAYSRLLKVSEEIINSKEDHSQIMQEEKKRNGLRH
jgi:hypothetical protein